LISWISALTLLHLLSTWSMVGLIWFVQRVHYPLFFRYQGDDFTAFARDHQQRTGWVVVPPMLCEAATSLALAALLLRADVGGAARILALLGLALLVIVWLSTFLLQVPCHAKLAEEELSAQQRSQTILRLVRTNWLRTVAWSLRGVIAAALSILLFAPR
jgi:hypothetical protein